MRYRYQAADEYLSAYIRTVLIVEGTPPGIPSRVPLFTNGMPALFYRFEKDIKGKVQKEELTLFGFSASPDHWEMNEDTTIIAYFFKPFTVSCIFNIPATELSKSPVNLFQIKDRSKGSVHIKLNAAKETGSKIEILNNFISGFIQKNERTCTIIQYATDQIMLHSGAGDLSVILKDLHLNERSFQRLFKKHVGITANQYRRICQFQLSFAQLNAERFDKLSDVAFENGYTDQSHFTRSFKEFSNTTPHDYIRFGLKMSDE